MRNSFCCIILFLLCCQFAYASPLIAPPKATLAPEPPKTTLSPTNTNTYYCDAINGSDANPGTSIKPWKTLSKAQSTVVGGDTVIMKKGAYGAYVEANITRSDWITYKAAPGAEVKLDKISLGKYDSDNNARFSHYLQFEDITIENPEDHGNGIGIAWGSYVRLYNLEVIGDGYRYPYHNGSSSKSKAINISRSNNIDIDSCHIYGTGPSLAKSWPGISPQFSDTSANANNHGQGWVYGIRVDQNNNVAIDANIIINNCLIEQCDVGILIYNTLNTTITNNHLRYLTSDGIELSNSPNNTGQKTTIAYNKIHDMHTFYNAKNECIGSHNDGIQLFDLYSTKQLEYKHLIVTGNIIYNSDQGMFFQVKNGNSTDWLIENNLVYNVPESNTSSSLAVRLYNATDIIFRNNTIDGGLTTEGNTLVLKKMTGNIIEIIDLYTDNGVTVDYEDYNIVNRKWYHMKNHTVGTNSIILNNLPLFETLFNDYNNNDLTLVAGSTAIDRGNPSNYPPTDITNASRDANPDAGCFEYGSSSDFLNNENVVKQEENE